MSAAPLASQSAGEARPRGWWPWVAWATVLTLIAIFGWAGWRAYDERAAVREVEALGFGFLEDERPFDLIRKDWHAAFSRYTWRDRERELFLPDGSNLAALRPLLMRLRPTRLQAPSCRHPEAVHGLTGLQWFEFIDSDVTDLSSMADLTHLERLRLTGCTGVTNFAPLASLTQLQTLDLDGCTGLKDLAPLANLTHLVRLNLTDCTGVADLNPLAGLAQLKYLTLTGCTGVADLAPLTGLAQLERLDLSGCTGVKDLAPLAGLAQLEQLELSGCTGLATEAVAAFRESHPQVSVGVR